MQSWLLGTLIAVAILLPNLLLAFFPPRTELPQPKVGFVFVALERAGQLGCLVLLIFAPGEFSQPIWGVLVGASIALYWGLWSRYLASRDARALFAPFGVIPIPMAVFPVLAFAFAAAWASSLSLAAATAVLAVGHLTVSWKGYRALTSDA